MKKSSQQLRESPPTGDVEETMCASQTDDGSLVSSLDLIWRVLCGRRYAVPEADMPDIAQEAVFRLWKWRQKYHEKASGLTNSEWDSFTATTAHNEIKRHFSKQMRATEVPLDDADLTRVWTPEGETDSEIYSLIRKVWQEICSLTQYQRRALLLGSPELLIYLIQFGVSERTVVASLEIRKEDWAEIFGRLPLSDREIAAISRSSKPTTDPEATTMAIGKARFDARKKLGRLKK
jgi:DNA-directed RNA polymerase specialized sigma24 family protein